MKKNLTSMIALPIFMVLAFGSSEEEESASSEATKTPAPAAAEKPAEAPAADEAPPAEAAAPAEEAAPAEPEQVVVNGLEITIKGAKFTQKVEQDYFDYSAGEDAKLLVIDYKVKNVSKEGKQCLSFADAVKDSEGIEYSSTTDCSMAINSWALDELNPGLSKSYQACFEVPDTMAAEGLQIKFDCMFESELVDLGKVE